MLGMTGDADAGWKRELALPVHDCFADLIARLSAKRFPGCAELNALLDERHRSGSGVPIRFVSAGEGALRDEPYEARIFRLGEVITREQNWHDLFNALAWLAFPATKRELNAIHGEQLSLDPTGEGRRGTTRDVLTLFDESGLLVACADASLAALLTGFQWKELFWTRREDVERHMRFFVFGHALHEHALKPYPGITGKALIVDVDEGFLQASPSGQRTALDGHAAQWLRARSLTSTRLLTPLPMLGIPGWDADNAHAAYYDNTDVFRPGRRLST